MPQYKRVQYGLKQYGTFIPISDVESSGRWQFVRARFGMRIKGRTVWLYQHTPATVSGRVRRIRIRSNTGECITERRVTYRGEVPQVRLRCNTGESITAQSMRN